MQTNDEIKIVIYLHFIDSNIIASFTVYNTYIVVIELNLITIYTQQIAIQCFKLRYLYSGYVSENFRSLLRLAGLVRMQFIWWIPGIYDSLESFNWVQVNMTKIPEEYHKLWNTIIDPVFPVSPSC